MHGDEANQAWQFKLLYEDSHYQYTPEDYHGPSLYFLTLPWMWFSGEKNFSELTPSFFRSFPATFSIGTCLLVFLLLKELGRKICLICFWFLAISPALVFYSRYYIQESLLVFFSFLWFIALWKWSQTKSHLWLGIAASALAFMFVTKETFIIALASSILALIVSQWQAKNILDLIPKHKKQLLAFFIPFVFIYVLFFSSFFQNPKGVLDGITAFGTHFSRGLGSEHMPENTTSGAGHAKPWHYYLKTLSWNYSNKAEKIPQAIAQNSPIRPLSEHAIVLGLVFASLYGLFRFKSLSPFAKYAFIYTILLWLIYSLIPYKTPWCLLTALQASIVLFPLILKEWIQTSINRKFTYAFLGLVLFISPDLIRQITLQQNSLAASTHNPWVYSHTVYDIERLETRIRELAEQHPEKKNMPIHVLTSDFWPLPWYLRSYTAVGYWEDKIPDFELGHIPVLIISNENEALGQQLNKTHVTDLFGLRPGVYLNVMIRRDLWNQLLSSRHEN